MEEEKDVDWWLQTSVTAVEMGHDNVEHAFNETAALVNSLPESKEANLAKGLLAESKGKAYQALIVLRNLLDSHQE